MLAKWSQRAVWASAVFLALSLCYQFLSFFYHKYDEVSYDLLHDFSDVFWGETKEHVFRVQNTGRSPLVISAVVSDCGCATVGTELKGKIIPSGDTISVPVRLNVQKIQGKFTKKIRLEFADASRQALVLMLSGNAKPRVTWSPEKLVFSGLGVEDKSMQTITLAAVAGAPPLKITGVSTNSSFLATKLCDEKRPGAEEYAPEWIVTVSTVPPLPLGRTEGYVFIHTSNPAAIPISIETVLVVKEGK